MAQKKRDELNDLLRDVDLCSIVEALGGRVRQIGGGRGETTCVFHDDHNPSLKLYPADGQSNPHFHCYSCNAHGDALNLIQQMLGCDFPEAKEWLANHQGKPVPTIPRLL